MNNETAVTSLSNGTAVTVHIGERLDFSANGVLQHAAKRTKNPDVREVVIDLDATTRLYDSGMALLMLLRKGVGRLKDQIYVVNCCPEIRKVLSSTRYERFFHVV